MWKWVLRQLLGTTTVWAVKNSRSWWAHCLAAVILPLGNRGKRVQRERGGKRQGSIHGAPRDEVDNWVWNNTANNLGSLPFKRKENWREWNKKEGEEMWKKGVREKIPATLWGESCYWKAIKLAFSRIDWKWRGLLKERDKGTIARLWSPYVALFSASFFAGGGGGQPCLFKRSHQEKQFRGGLNTGWIEPSLSSSVPLPFYSPLSNKERLKENEGRFFKSLHRHPT